MRSTEEPVKEAARLESIEETPIYESQREKSEDHTPPPQAGQVSEAAPKEDAEKDDELEEDVIFLSAKFVDEDSKNRQEN